MFWEEALQGPVAEQVLQGNQAGAEAALDTAEYLFYADPQPDQNLFMRSDNVPFAMLFPHVAASSFRLLRYKFSLRSLPLSTRRGV